MPDVNTFEAFNAILNAEVNIGNSEQSLNDLEKQLTGILETIDKINSKKIEIDISMGGAGKSVSDMISSIAKDFDRIYESSKDVTDKVKQSFQDLKYRLVGDPIVFEMVDEMIGKFAELPSSVKKDNKQIYEEYVGLKDRVSKLTSFLSETGETKIPGVSITDPQSLQTLKVSGKELLVDIQKLVEEEGKLGRNADVIDEAWRRLSVRSAEILETLTKEVDASKELLDIKIKEELAAAQRAQDVQAAMKAGGDATQKEISLLAEEAKVNGKRIRTAEDYHREELEHLDNVVKLRLRLQKFESVPLINFANEIRSARQLSDVMVAIGQEHAAEKTLQGLSKESETAAGKVDKLSQRLDALREKSIRSAETVGRAEADKLTAEQALAVARGTGTEVRAINDLKKAVTAVAAAKRAYAQIQEKEAAKEDELAKASTRAMDIYRKTSDAAAAAKQSQLDVRKLIDPNVEIEQANKLIKAQQESQNALVIADQRQLELRQAASQAFNRSRTADLRATANLEVSITEETTAKKLALTTRSVADQEKADYAVAKRQKAMAEDVAQTNVKAANQAQIAFNRAIADREKALQNATKQQELMDAKVQEADQRMKEALTVPVGEKQLTAIRDAEKVYGVAEDRALRYRQALDQLKATEVTLAEASSNLSNATSNAGQSTFQLAGKATTMAEATRSLSERAQLSADIIKAEGDAKLFNAKSTEAAGTAALAQIRIIDTENKVTEANTLTTKLNAEAQGVLNKELIASTSARSAAVEQSMRQIVAMQNTSLVATAGFRDRMVEIGNGMALVSAKGGNAFLGLRQALFGVSDTGNIVAKVLDLLGNRANNITDITNRYAKASLILANEGKDLSNILANQVKAFQNLANQEGIAQSELTRFNIATQKVQGAWLKLSDIIQSKGMLTPAQMQQVIGEMEIARQNVQLFETSLESVKGIPPGVREGIKVLSGEMNQLNTMARLAIANYRAYQESEKQVTIGEEKHVSILSKLGGAFSNLFKSITAGSKSNNDFFNSFKKVSTGAAEASTSMQKFSTSINQASIVSNIAKGVFTGVSFALFGIGGLSFALMGAAMKVRELGKAFMGVNEDVQNFKAMIMAMERGQEDLAGMEKEIADNLVTYLIQVARDAPGNIANILDVAQRMIMQGIDVKAWMMPITDIAAATNRSVDEVMDVIQKLVVGSTAMAMKGFRTMGLNLKNVTGYFNAATGEVLSFDDAMRASKMSAEELARAGIKKLGLEFKNGTELTTGAANALNILNAYFRQSPIYSGAAATLSATFTGKLDDLKDAFNELSLAFGTPILTALTGTLTKLSLSFDGVRSRVILLAVAAGTQFANAIQAVSDFVASLFDRTTVVGNVVSRLVGFVYDLFSGNWVGAWRIAYQAVKDAVDWIIDYLGYLIQDAQSYGYNFIVEVANGIVDAANGVLRDTLIDVGNMIANYLAPGSPPKMGPLSTIDEWGRALMEVFGASIGNINDFKEIQDMTADMEKMFRKLGYTVGAEFVAAFSHLNLNSAIQAVINATNRMGTLVRESIAGLTSDMFKGLKAADFGSIKDMMAPIEDFFKEIMGEAGAGPFKAVQSNLIQLIAGMNSTGTISEDIFGRINALLGDQGKELSELLRAQLELRAAQQGLLKDTQALANAKRALFAADKRVGELEQQIADAQAAGLDTTALREQLAIARADFRVQEQTYNTAYDAQQLSQDQQDAADGQIAALQEEVDWRKAMLEFQKASNDYEKSFLKTIQNTAEKGGEAQREQVEKTGETVEQEYARETALLDQKYKAGAISEKEYVQGLIQAEERYVDASSKNGITANLNDHLDKIRLLKIRLGEIKDLGAGEAPGIVPKINLGAFKPDKKIIQDWGAGFSGAGNAAGDGFISGLIARLTADLPQLADQTVGPALQKSLDGFKANFAPLTDGIKIGIETGDWTAVSKILSAKMMEVWNTVSTVIWPKIAAKLYIVGSIIWGMLPKSFKDKASEIIATVSNAFSAIIQFVKDTWKNILDFFDQAIGQSNIGKNLALLFEQLLPILKLVGIAIAAILVLAAGVVAGVINAIGAAMPFIIGIISGITLAITGALRIINGVFGIIMDFINLIVLVVSTAVAVVNDIITTGGKNLPQILGTALEALSAIWSSMLGHLGEIVKGIYELAAGIIQVVINIFAGALAAVSGFVSGIVTFISGLLEKIGLIGPDTKKTIDEFVANFTRAPAVLRDVVNRVSITLYQLLAIARTNIDNFVKKFLEIQANIAIGAKGMYDAAVAWLQNFIDGLVAKFWDISYWLTNNLYNIPTNMLAKATEFFNAAKNWADNTLSGISTGWAGVTKWLDENVFNLPKKFYDLGANIMTNLKQGLSDMLSGITDPASGVLADLMSYFPHSPATKGPLSVSIDWLSYFTAGLDAAISAISGIVSSGISAVWQAIFGGGVTTEDEAGKAKMDAMAAGAAAAATNIKGSLITAFYEIETEFQVIKTTISIGFGLLAEAFATEDAVMTANWNTENTLRLLGFDSFKASLFLKFGELKTSWSLLMYDLDLAWDTELANLKTAFGVFKDDISNYVDEITRKLQEIIKKLQDIETEADQAIKDLVPLNDVAFDDLQTRLDTLYDRLKDIIKKAKDAAKALQDMNSQSPPPSGGGSGGQNWGSGFTGAAAGAWNIQRTMPMLLHRGESVLPADIAESWRKLMTSIARTDSIGDVGMPNTLPAGVGMNADTGSQRTIVISPTFNTTIHDEMDMALFESRIIQVIQRGILPA